MRLAWDATVCIDFLNGHKELYPGLRSIVEDARAKKIDLIVSTLAIAETTRLEGGEPAEQIRKSEAFFDASYVKVYAFEQFIAKKARIIRTQHPMDSADAGHVATAVVAKCDFFLTDDGNAAKTKRNLLRYDRLIDVGDPPGQWKLRILTPSQYDQEHIQATHPLMAQAAPVAVLAQATAPLVSATRTDDSSEIEAPKAAAPGGT